jgi:outer membrane protein OmpA-like peptidoglycan-associated protein
MKKLLCFLLASGGVLSAFAQAPSNNTKADSSWRPTHFAPDGLLSHWVLDVNLLGGGVSQTYTTHNNIANYNGGISEVSNTGKLTFDNGLAYGFDAQIGYFFGRSNHFGIGTGIMLLREHGNIDLDQFHVEYRAADYAGNVYRQLITSEGKIREKVEATNINIPLLLKYKYRFSRHWGFTADLGALFNLQMNTTYSSNAKFDYEAIYKLSGSGTEVTSSYDPTPVPLAGDVLYTKAEYTRVNPGLDVNTYFNRLRGNGLNVGLGVQPNHSEGSTSFMTGNVGLLAQPGVNFYLSDMVALSIGGYFMYQPFETKTSDRSLMLTNKLGDYSSVLGTTKDVANFSYGGNLGVRVYLGKGRDGDHDGIPDRLDRCPDVYGSIRFNGCPDSDGDGIADIDDACPNTPGIAKFHGCPDSDGDGIPDKDDACPNAPGTEKYHGCPDRDGDGIIDKDDACPDKPGLAIYKGCPDTDGDGIPDNEDACPNEKGTVEFHGCPPPPVPVQNTSDKMNTPILFEVNKTIIHKSSYPTLIEAAKRLNDEPGSFVTVDGYTDNTGSFAHNQKLSTQRAQAVKTHLIRNMGIDAKRIKILGHSEGDPVAPNDTPENRLKNRRAVMHLTLGE